MAGRRVVALTGAGCSTESGIPDYRGPETARRARNPIRFDEYARSAQGRQRYWARSVLGWPRIAQARPNPAHHALADLERAGHVRSLITQNVDRLHHKAGQRAVIELHGALEEVVCLGCGALRDRAALQARLLALNPGWAARTAEPAPDGDAELTAVEGFQVVDCAICGGLLKPHVVFFGEGVPRDRVTAAQAAVDAADVLLVVGSSLTVFSGYRFVKQAAAAGKPVAIVNLGPTRGDPFAAVRVDAPAGEALPALAEALR
ncbi:MAG: NAD-dependent protein deacetylase [Alphaproteobacteria bacterium]|nr:NAD-dependent protein deacetylase [Alphaproteobacteria bacterium]